LTNAVCDTLDRRLRGVAKRFGLHYSRYADDMTFSSMHNVYQENSEFRQEIKRIIEDQGFKMNEKKTRLLRDGQRQEVTGLTVNSVVNVSRQYISDLRWILSVWEREGYAKAYSYFYPLYKREKGYIKKGEPVLENVIDGKLNYLRMIKGSEDNVYQKLHERYLSLSPCLYSDKETDKGEKYVFVQSYTVKEFEDKFDTKVEIRCTEKGSLIGRCMLFDKEKFISINKATKSWLEKNGKHVTNEDGLQLLSSKFLPLCYITLCRQKGMNFWLISQNEPPKTTIFRWNKNVPVDKLIEIWKRDGIEAAANLFHKFCTGEMDSETDLSGDNNVDNEKLLDFPSTFVDFSDYDEEVFDDLPFLFED
jgi:hypothetical protein